MKEHKNKVVIKDKYELLVIIFKVMMAYVILLLFFLVCIFTFEESVKQQGLFHSFIRDFYHIRSFQDILIEIDDMYKLPDSVDICNYTTMEPQEFIKKYVNKFKPCLLKGYAKIQPAYEKWQNDTYLRQMAGDEVIYAERQKDNRFAYFTDGAKRVYMKYSEFLDTFAQDDREFNYYYSFDDPPASLKDDIIEIPMVQGYLTINILTFWHGFGTLTKPHTDDMDNIICVFKGYKNFTIVPPHHTKYVYPGHNGLPENYSPIEFVNPDYEQFPLFRNAKVTYALVEAGDCLYMPSVWWHQVDSGPGVTLALSHWYNTQQDMTNLILNAMRQKYI